MIIVVAFCAARAQAATPTIKEFQGYCLDSYGRSYNFCGLYASSGEECKEKIMSSSTAVGGNYISSTGVCDLRYEAGFSVHHDGSCGAAASSRSARGYPKSGDFSSDAVCYAKCCGVPPTTTSIFQPSTTTDPDDCKCLPGHPVIGSCGACLNCCDRTGGYWHKIDVWAGHVACADNCDYSGWCCDMQEGAELLARQQKDSIYTGSVVLAMVVMVGIVVMVTVGLKTRATSKRQEPLLDKIVAQQ